MNIALLYIRDEDLHKIGDLEAFFRQMNVHCGIRNPRFFTEREPADVVLVDARYPEISRSYQEAGVRVHVSDVKNLDHLDENDLNNTGQKKSGPPAAGGEGARDSVDGEGDTKDPEVPQENPSPPESPAPSPAPEKEEQKPAVKPSVSPTVAASRARAESSKGSKNS